MRLARSFSTRLPVRAWNRDWHRRLTQWSAMLTLALFSCSVCLLLGCSNLTLKNASPKLDTAPNSATRTISHAMGTAQVPIVPQRVVTLDTAALDAALAVGVKPVGSVVYGSFPDYLGEQTASIQSLGDINQPNLEVLIGLNPDLIVGTKIGSRSIYQKVTNVAPTVFSEGSGRSGDWQETFRLYAEALGKADVGEEALHAYRQQVSQLRQQLGDVADMQVSVLTTGQGSIGFYTLKSFSGSVLQDVGFDRPPAQKRPSRWAKMVSREDLDSLDGDFIFLIHSDTFPGSLAKQEFISDPVWSQLEAVKQNQVYQVKDEAWTSGRNILAAQQILSDIEHALVGSE